MPGYPLSEAARGSEGMLASVAMGRGRLTKSRISLSAS